MSTATITQSAKPAKFQKLSPEQIKQEAKQALGEAKEAVVGFDQAHDAPVDPHRRTGHPAPR